MTDHGTLAIPRLVAGVLITLALSDRATAQSRATPVPRQSARTARNPQPVSQDLPQAEILARQDLAKAQQLAQSGGHDEDAIRAAREALKAHIKPAPGTHDDLTLQALSLLVSLHSRTGQLAEEVGVRRELLDALTGLLEKGDWRVLDAIDGLADAEHRLAATPERRRRLTEASECFKQAIVLVNAGRLDEAPQPAVQATEIYREVEGDDHRDVSNVLVLRGIIHRARREYTTAGAMFEQAILVRRKVLGENHPDTVLVLQQMANLAEARGDVAQAARLFERAVELDQQAAANQNAANENAARAELLETIARLLALQGDHAGARPYLERAAAIRERLAFFESAGGISRLTFPGMRRSGSRLGGGFPAMFGDVYGGMGSPFGSRRAPFSRSGFDLGRQRSTRDRPGMFGIGSHFDDMLEGGYGGRGMFGNRQTEDNMAMIKNPSHPWTLRLRAMQMYVHAAGGKEPAQVERIASAFEEGAIRGVAWLSYARNIGRLADLAEAQGEAEKARLLRLRSVAVGLEAADPAEPTRGEYAEFLDGFITLILEMGESRLAEDLALQSVVDRKFAWGDRSPAYAAGLDRLAEVLWARGDGTQAMLLLEKAREIRRAALGEHHFELAASSYRLALLHEEGGDRDIARREAGNSLELSEAFLMAGLPFLPERQRLAFLAQSTRALSLFLDVTSNGPDDAPEAYRHLLAWKGVATEAAAAQRAATVAPELRVLSEELSRARDDLNQLFYAVVPPEQSVAHAHRVRAQTKLRDEVETRLAEAVRWHPTSPHPDQVAEALPLRAVLVDFARYQHYVPAPGPKGPPRIPRPSTTHFRLAPGAGPAMSFEARYAAFVVRHGDSKLVRVELGPAAPIDAAVMTWLDRIEHGGDLETPAKQLAQDLWAPLVPYIGTAGHVLISPDGPLNFLPWGALPGKSLDSYLLADHAFSLVGAARFLAQSRPETDTPRSRSLLVVGGVDYALAEATQVPGGERTQVAARSAPVGGKGLTLDALPGTLVEAEDILKLFGDESPEGGKVVLLTGSQATKGRVRTSLAGKRFLHLATHGYFASPEFASALIPEDTGASLHSLEGMDRSEVRGLYPGLLSGLIFAGANRPPRDSVTGLVDFGSAIMTAEEIAGLDLSACDLAVLSACETGRGSVAGGEGVLGLQRAFHQAGARTVVASLWKVNDQATAALMALFYDRLWRQHQSPIEALRNAQLTLSRHPELVGKLATARGTPDFNKLVQRPDQTPGAGQDQGPKDRARVNQWAAFVLSGWGK